MKVVRSGVSNTPASGSGGTLRLSQPAGSEMQIVPTGGGATFDDARMNRLFTRCGKKPPDWKRVIYDARHGSSIIGFQIQQLAAIRALIEPVVEFETRPGKWVRAADYQTDDPDVRLAIDIATSTWSLFRSSAGNQAVALKQAAEVFGSVGEGYGIEYEGRNGKPAVSIVHCPAVNVRKDGTAEWTRRRNAAPVILRPGQFQRLYREDETFDEDCTSPWRHLVDDIICYEIVCAALKKAATSDALLRGLVWAPSDGPNQSASWVSGYMDLVEDVMRDPDLLGGLMPYPVVGGVSAPEHVDFGSTIHDGLLKLHELFVDKIARGSVWPAQLVKEGPGAGNAYADHALNRQFLQTTVWTDLFHYVYPDIACWWWHPKLDANRQFQQTGIASCRFRINGDIAKLANRPDSRKEVLEALKCGVMFSDAFITETFGASEDDLLTPGTDEYDRRIETMLLLRGNDREGGESESTPFDPGRTDRESDGFTLGDPLGPRFAEVAALW